MSADLLARVENILRPLGIGIAWAPRSIDALPAWALRETIGPMTGAVIFGDDCVIATTPPNEASPSGLVWVIFRRDDTGDRTPFWGPDCYENAILVAVQGRLRRLATAAGLDLSRPLG